MFPKRMTGFMGTYSKYAGFDIAVVREGKRGIAMSGGRALTERNQ